MKKATGVLGKKDKLWADLVKERENWTCQRCGTVLRRRLAWSQRPPRLHQEPKEHPAHDLQRHRPVRRLPLVGPREPVGRRALPPQIVPDFDDSSSSRVLKKRLPA
jgi:hypothetical protein